MNANSRWKTSRLALQLVVLASIVMLALPVVAQDQDYAGRSKALDDANSRAEREAEQMVSLPAQKIIALLDNEPGLFLQVKKMLVRKAYQQGRLLDPQDLTDEALFRLIRKDETVRILITHEIEDRNYIRAKPTKAELEQDFQRRTALAAQVNPRRSDSQLDRTSSQEDRYWSEQERRSRGSQSQPSGVPSSPQNNPRTPQLGPNNDPRRQVLQAQAGGNDYPSGLPFDVVNMPRVNPDDLGQLLSANQGSDSALKASTELAVNSNNSAGSSGLGSESPLPQFTNKDYERDAQEVATVEAPPRPVPSLPSSGRQDPIRLQRRANPYADVPSLYDLYSQYSRRSPVLDRFGAEIFRNGTGNFDQLPMDLPVGPDYVLGPGDSLNIDLWGSVSQRLKRVVDRQGRIALPEVGGVPVTGRTLGDVQHLVQTALRTQFRDLDADVSLGQLRTIRVYVVGDVERAGAYDISSLSTPLNALYEAGGPTSRGSMRILKHYRGKQLVENVDLYDLLLHGVHGGMERMQSGDTLLVPPMGPEVTVQGMVRRPAIYELNDEKSLAEILQLAGGVLASGTLRHVDVERVQAHQSRTMLAVDVPENSNQAAITETLEKFIVQDGDAVKISPILPFADQTVFLDGHVFRPGKYAYREGMKVTDLIHSYKDVLPEPYKAHAEIIRLKAPDNTPEVLAFNLEDALSGKAQDVELRPFDTVRVFGRFDFEDPPVITVSGEVRDPGDHITNGATYLRDAVYLAGNTTPDAQLDDAQVFRKTEDGKLKVLSVNLGKALAGDARDNILLQPKDRLFIYKNLAKVDPPTVSIQGEVARPGKYALGQDMTAAQLVRVAGGLKRSAYTQQADLTRYVIEQGSHVMGEHQNVALAKALSGEPDSDVALRDGDVLTVRQLGGWDDIGASITLDGEVVHPGTYGIENGERLSSVIARAGGFQKDAYAYGAILERAQVRELEEKNRASLIEQVRQEGNGIKAAPEDPVAKDSYYMQWKDTLQKLESTPPAGRLVIHISGDVKKWANTSADIQVRAGDVLFIPKKPNFVMVQGAVYNQTAITYKGGKSAAFYLGQAGGPTSMADKKNIFVIRADGSVVGGKGGLFNGGALEAQLQPGDMVVVPDKAFGGGFKWRDTLQVAQLVSAVGIAVQVARSF